MTPKPRTTGGFSLIELLCSMGIGSLLLLLAASVLGGSGAGYERVGGGVAAEREARALLSQMGSDLASARFHKDGVLEKSVKPWPVDRLGFLSLQPAIAQSDAGRIGDLCAVSYYVKDLVIGGRTVRCLMRGFRPSVETFNALDQESVPTLFDEQEPIDEPVAFGVVSFEVSPKVRDPSGRWVEWVKNDTAGPEALDVRLVIARRELAGRLELPADWDGAGTHTDLLGEPSEVERNANLEVFGTLIRYGNHDHG